MSKVIYSALSGMKLKELELDILSNNIANVNTNGFKEQKVSFKSVLSQTQQEGSVKETPFAAVNEFTHNFTQGPVHQTNSAFDIALLGKGFLEVSTKDGLRYTRNGTMTVNQEGYLATQSGDAIQGTSGLISMGNGSRVVISQQGVVTVDGEEKGQIKRVQFDNPKKLSAVGANYFEADPSAGAQEDEQTILLQGSVEESNSNVVGSLVKLIEVSRQFSSYQKVIQNQAKLEQDGVTQLGQIG